MAVNAEKNHQSFSKLSDKPLTMKTATLMTMSQTVTDHIPIDPKTVGRLEGWRAY
jgi:hypothetical protein